MWVLRSPQPDPRGRPGYLVKIDSGRIATSLEAACARRFNEPEDCFAFMREHPEAAGWVLVRTP
jgi:hypothetical protein